MSDGIIDWDIAGEFIPGGNEAIVAVASVLLVECPRLISEIEEGIATSDAERVNRAAHTLKSSAKYFGAQSVVDAALKLEQLSGEPSLDRATELFDELRHHAAQLHAALENRVNSPS